MPSTPSGPVIAAIPISAAPDVLKPRRGKVGDRLAENVWQAPLVPAALAMTAGILFDRYASVPLGFSLLVCAASLVAWAIIRREKPAGLALLYLAVGGAAVGAAYHHWYWNVYPSDDIGNYASETPHVVRLRGVLVEEPVVVWQVHQGPGRQLRSFDPRDATRAVLQVKQFRSSDGWQTVSGHAQLLIGDNLHDPDGAFLDFERGGQFPVVHAGDEVEVVGWIGAPQGPSNPGEADNVSFLRDQRIRAIVLIEKTVEGMRVVQRGWPRSLAGWLGVVRGWGQRVLQQALLAKKGGRVPTLPNGWAKRSEQPELLWRRCGVAMALILGEGSTMTSADWDKYKRTGVIHVLAVSGQHLVILAFFLWGVLRLFRVRRRRGAILIALFCLSYALLTGGRPAADRSAVMVCAFCGGIVLGLPTRTANTFALAWLVVIALNPTDLFDPGCQLSFLSVAVLYWGTSRWQESKLDPLDQIGEWPFWKKVLGWHRRNVFPSYVITVAIWLAIAHLLASHYHLVPPVGILIGPPVTAFASLALVAGFLLLLVAAICPPLIPVFGLVVDRSLAGCDSLVDLADRLPGGHWYVGNIPEWWLWAFYPGLLAFLILPSLNRHWRWGLLAAAAWVCVGLFATWTWPGPRDAEGTLRCTFLAVGHGGCTVIQTPSGRTLLYDAGAIGGSGVTRRQIAPFLWHRGVRRVDEVFLSHADLDHYNGLTELIERFPVGQVTFTPTFAQKSNEAVKLTLAALDRQHIGRRIVSAGDQMSAGEVDLQVLHPPPAGPEGVENVRSMVLLVRHAGHSILLTGDLEGLGLQRVLSLPAPRIDVLQAPHHGSRVANTPDLADWAAPKFAVSCQGPPTWPNRSADVYTARGAQFLGTWPHGAVTILSSRDRLVVETFVTGQRFVVRSGQDQGRRAGP